MDSGLIQILVIAFVIIISVMDGAARKKRREAQRQEAQRRGEVGGGEGVSELGEGRSMTTERMSERRMSEGLAPDEVWAEIAALAKGGPPPPSARQLPPLSGFERTLPVRVPEPEETMLTAEHQHVEGHDHVEWEWEPELEAEAEAFRLAPVPDEDPTSPVAPAPAEDPISPVAPTADEDPGRASRGPLNRRSVLRTLTHGGRASIQQAVILAEILGPPAALRDFGHEPPG